MNSNSEKISQLSLQKKRELLSILLANKSQNVHSYCLSPNQERLWQSLKITPFSSSYNIPFAYNLSGNLNIEILEKSIKNIIQRHDNLRCQILQENEIVKQNILPQLNWNLIVEDLSNFQEKEKNQQINKSINIETKTFFKLNQAPLWRIKLLKLEAEKYIFLLTMHHLISDRWSVGIFMQELATFYQEIIAHKTISLNQLPKQYKEFALWQKKWLETEEATHQLHYWQQQLSQAIPDVKLPIDIQLNLLTYRANRQYLILDENLTLSLKNLGDRLNVSLFIILLSAFQILLYEYNQQEEFIIASPVASRHIASSKGVIGYFNNILPIKVNLQENPNFTEVVKRVKKVTTEAYQNQDIPFQYLTNLSHIPLSRVMFALQNIPNLTIELPNIEINYQDLHNSQTNFDLFLFMEEKNGKLEANLEYKTDLFNANTITNFLNNFQQLLTKIVINPESNINSFPRLKELNSYAEFNHNINPKDEQNIFVEPRNSLEQQLTEIWQEILGIEKISIKDNFFLLGGHSLLSVKLVDKVEKTLNIKLSLNTLQQLTTIEQMAININSNLDENELNINANYSANLSYENYRRLLASIASREEKRIGDKGIILEVQEGLKNKNPVFLIGSQFNFLKDKINIENPIYCLPSTWMEIENPQNYVKDLAEFYTEEITKINSKQPIFLIGYCFEALVAWEIAQNLDKKGLKVNCLVIVEREGTDINYHRYHRLYLGITEKFNEFLKLNFIDKLKFTINLSYKQLQKFKQKLLTSTKKIPKINSKEDLIRLNKNDDVPQGLETLRVAINSYYPQPYSGKVAFIFAKENRLNSFIFPKAGWHSVVKGENEIFMLSGEHKDLLIESKSSAQLADFLHNMTFKF